MPLTNFPFGGFFAKPSVRAALPGSALLSANGAGFDLVGKVLQVNDPTGTYGFSYDNMGRLIGTTTQYTFLPSNNFTNSYTYDADSNRLTLTDPQGGVTSYAYDTLNRLSTLTPPTAFSSTGFGFTYDALSRRTQMTRPNGVTTNYTYDNLSHLLSVLHQVSSSTIDGTAYTYDSAGNRTAKTNEKTAVTSNYTYDPLYELMKVTQSTNTTESYSYDPAGNRLSSLGVSSYTNNSSNELTSSSASSYAYDANGNTTSKTVSGSTTNYTWDYENRLISVVLPGAGGSLAFKYDGLGRRVQKAFTQGSTTTTTNYLYDGVSSIEDVDQNGNVLARYEQTTNTDEPLAELRSGTTSYYQADGLGSITSLSSSAGALANTYTYDSFGNLTASTGSLVNRFQYTGREFDPETGIYYYRARYYDSTAGRLLSEDPIGFLGNGPNFYRYVGENPLRYRDPFGLSPYTVASCFLKGAGLGAVGALAVGGLALGAVTLGAPVVAVTGVLGVVAVAGGVALGFDVSHEISTGDWNGLAFNLGSLTGSSLVGGLGGRALAEGLNGVASPPWSLPSDWAQGYNPNLGSPADWLGTGTNPGSAGGSAALGGAGAARFGRSQCGCQ
jgi:RHS repeat-associated protein